MEPIPHNWADIQPDIIYQNGRVATDGTIGLFPSQEEGYDLKSKVLGEGGDYRYHGKYIEGVLHFHGVKTSH